MRRRRDERVPRDARPLAEVGRRRAADGRPLAPRARERGLAPGRERVDGGPVVDEEPAGRDFDERPRSDRRVPAAGVAEKDGIPRVLGPGRAAVVGIGDARGAAGPVEEDELVPVDDDVRRGGDARRVPRAGRARAEDDARLFIC